jgi:hypothetical protein
VRLEFLSGYLISHLAFRGFSQWLQANERPKHVVEVVTKPRSDVQKVAVWIPTAFYSVGLFLRGTVAEAWSLSLTPSHVEAKNEWSYVSTTQHAFMLCTMTTLTLLYFKANAGIIPQLCHKIYFPNPFKFEICGLLGNYTASCVNYLPTRNLDPWRWDRHVVPKRL